MGPVIRPDIGVFQPAPIQRPAAATAVKPKISMRPITTPVNILVCGGSSTGKSRFIRDCTQLLHPDSTVTVAAASGSDDPHAVLLAGADDFATTLQPIMVPEAGRALVYKFQDCPGHGATLNSAGYLEDLLAFLYKQQERDHKQLRGSRGMHKSLACGCLQHSITACLYFLPVHGPTKLDLVMMAALAKLVALVPVVGKADTMDEEEAAACTGAVWNMLAAPQDYVAGLEPIEPFKFYGSGSSTSDPVLPLLSKISGSSAESSRSRPLDGLTQLTELLTGDEVYDLLDYSWDKYNKFCDSYEGAADEQSSKRLSRLVSASREADISPYLASTANLQDVKEEFNEARDKHKKELDKEARLLEELWDLVTSYRNETCYGYPSYTFSQHTDLNSISTDLKRRLPGLSEV